MVKICEQTYPENSLEIYQKHFDTFPFPLSPFQKYAIESIVTGNHILVTAHTGSGKTLPAEFAIEYFIKLGKKVIYTSPIKALSNQKFYEFSKKFPHISFGILTGDIKFNPEADVLIMTTEILMNTLYMKKNGSNNPNLTTFDMNFDTELACVIFDEVHYINDADRGRVWEETIMMLPRHVQMVMLSATIDAPERFASWCETRGDRNVIDNKIVYLTGTNERVVPLTHYSFITCGEGFYKSLKDKDKEKEIRKLTNTLHVIQDSKGKFHIDNFNTIKKTLNLFETKRHYVKRQHVMNQVTKHMVENAMLPAICFILSRKQLEQTAKEVTTVLLEDDSKIPYIVRNECEQIIRKLPNFMEYLQLPEYVNMVALLEKGIAIHHAGIMPVLREMVELLFSKGYVKLLFATETFAVGINMPTKTVLFTDTSKFDGNGNRCLLSHEYTQMAGRAGRRGIDKVGHVIHLTNLFRNVETLEIKTMMNSKPQKLTSKFKVSYNLLLNLVDIGETDYTKYARRSMIQGDIDNTIQYYNDEIIKSQNEIERLEQSLFNLRNPREIVEEYVLLLKQQPNSINKKRKEIERGIKAIIEQYKDIDRDVELIKKYNFAKNECNELTNQLNATERTLHDNVQVVIDLLLDTGLIIKKNTIDLPDIIQNVIVPYEMTLKGTIATHLREVHCLIFSEIILSGELKQFDSRELVGIFSCFTNITVPDDLKCIVPQTQLTNVSNFIVKINEKYIKQSDSELSRNIDTGIDYNIHFDLVDYLIRWCDCLNDADCKSLLTEISCDKELFLGEFVKAVLKINNISAEMEKIAELIGDIELLHKLKRIPALTLKFIATNQSLYV